jgi:hypothetical protein
MLVDVNGKLINSKKYVASKPSKAALKVYYSYMRAHKSPQKENLFKQGMIVSTNDEKYMDALCQVKQCPELIVRLVKVSENSSSAKMYSYLVKYECNLNPNKHEIDHCIVKVAVATPIA